jgi:hypothetical protein
MLVAGQGIQSRLWHRTDPIELVREMIELFPDDLIYRNQIAYTSLRAKSYDDAAHVEQ